MYIMFIDHLPSIVPPEQAVVPNTPPLKERKKILLVVGGFLLLLMMGGSIWWYLNAVSKRKKAPPQVTENPPIQLPENPIPSSEDLITDPKNPDFKAENLAFGSFYKSQTETYPQSIKNVDLPLNVKSQVANYYTVSRKINLDNALPTLNKNGFAIIPNPFPKGGDNFFTVYNELKQRSVPLLVTSDFLLYYYQNSLKQIYKDVEASFFYENLWKVNKQMFEVANNRYLERRRKLGVTTDPLLEAQRLEAAYFATSLQLLSPKANQVGKTEDLSNTTIFSPSEATKYQFTTPEYLMDDINQEITLIAAANKTEKSPVMLYLRNYVDFKVPNDYATSAKLKNFYQASRWQSTIFPLRYRNDLCPDCLLDQDDWTINQIAAYLISEDMSANQGLKNDWAKVYKVTSFFSGLSSGLTYLHYQTVRQEVFPDKNIEDIFASDTIKNLEKMQEKLKSIYFKPAEGGLNDTTASIRSGLGMRLLQTSYWPDHYIYDRLTFASAGSYALPGNNSGKVMTACYNNIKKESYRCRGIGFDILGTVTTDTPTTPFITDNIKYKDYSSQRTSLMNELANYNKGEWYVNNFWTTLSIVKPYVNEKLTGLPYSKTPAWKDRQTTLALSGLTNMSVSADEWQINRRLTDPNLQSTPSNDDTNIHFIETQNALNDELLANSTMLFQALAALQVVKDTDSQFKELIDKLTKIREIGRKELKGETLSADNYQFIVELVSQYTVSKVGSRTVNVGFYDPISKRTQNTKQTLTPLKLLLMIYEINGQKMLVAGPVLDYKEE